MFRLILTFIIIYLIFRLLTGWLFPRIVRWYVEKQKRRFYENNPGADQARGRRPQNVHKRSGTPPGAAPSDKLGEYVDYEEINGNDKADPKK